MKATIQRPGEIVPRRISVTELIGSPLVRRLTHDHGNEFEEDASDKLWAFLGNAAHEVVQKAAGDNAFVEEAIRLPYDGWTISGRPDLFFEDGLLVDIKLTSVWGAVFWDKEPKLDWINQLHLYAYLFRSCGFTVERAQIWMILRDHMASKAGSDNYPPIPFKLIEVAIHSQSQIKKYIDRRLKLHGQGLLAEEIHLVPRCTPEERWEKPTTYAVMKKGRKSAVRVLDSLAGAMAKAISERAPSIMEDPPAFAQGETPTENLPSHWVEIRSGGSMKCKRYCRARFHCPFNEEEPVK